MDAIAAVNGGRCAPSMSTGPTTMWILRVSGTLAHPTEGPCSKCGREEDWRGRGRAVLVGGLSRGVRGGQTRRPVGSGVSHLLTCYTTHKQHDVYVYVGLCVCRSVTPNSGVKSEKHFHELIHSAAKERSPALAPGHLITYKDIVVAAAGIC